MRIPRSILVLMTAAALNGCDAPLASDDAGAAYAGDGGDAAILFDPDAVQGGESTIVIDDIAITNALGAAPAPAAPASEGGSDDGGESADASEGGASEGEGDGEELQTLDPDELQLWRDLFANGDCPTCGMG